MDTVSRLASGTRIVTMQSPGYVNTPLLLKHGALSSLTHAIRDLSER